MEIIFQESCIDRCSRKFLNANQRLIGLYMNENVIRQKRMAEEQQQLAEKQQVEAQESQIQQTEMPQAEHGTTTT